MNGRKNKIEKKAMI